MSVGMIVAAIIIVLIAIVLRVASKRPDTFAVERTTSINAPAEAIFPYINDFHKWALWSPYEKLDPAMKKTFTGAETGIGSVYEWEGNAKAGQGRITNVESAPPSKIVLKLDMIKPFSGNNVVTFTLVPSGGHTDVTWAMTGPTAFMVKVIGMFASMDSMMGGQFEEGLASLKTVAENGAG